jgi:hypothetical protein
VKAKSLDVTFQAGPPIAIFSLDETPGDDTRAAEIVALAQ